ncbi:NAD(P)-dependent oxidoreductase [Rathayibacter sp. KR2-224]|uniref:NAD(P)-dependent oxidoreductase n=1 Tax=Rathayibacter sp. KR2-224 TaxID=3400913 RepID=UPI003C111273
MRIAVIGATGRTGSLTVTSALSRGDDVTAITRSPEKLGDLGPRVRVVQASATDVDALAQGIRDADAVVSALGHSSSSGEDVLAEGIRATVAAMERTGVRRIAFISAAGHSTDGDGWFTRAVVKPLLGAFLRKQFADTKQAERELLSSGLEWTIVRPPMLRDGDARGYVSREWLNVRGHFTMNRSDLADAMLDLVTDAPPRRIYSVASAKPGEQRSARTTPGRAKGLGSTSLGA